MTERMPEPVVVEWDQPSKVCKGMTVGERITYHQRRRWEAGADWDWQYERDLLEDEVAEQHPEKKPGFPEPGSPEFLVQAAQMAEAMHGLYVALQDAGFDTQEALYLVSNMMRPV